MYVNLLRFKPFDLWVELERLRRYRVAERHVEMRNERAELQLCTSKNITMYITTLHLDPGVVNRNLDVKMIHFRSR